MLFETIFLKSYSEIQAIETLSAVDEDFTFLVKFLAPFYSLVFIGPQSCSPFRIIWLYR